MPERIMILGTGYSKNDGTLPASAAAIRSGALFRLASGRQVATVMSAFAPGERVRDAWGHEGTVLQVIGKAEYGIGRVTVRFDDGREVTFAALAHGLELIRHD